MYTRLFICMKGVTNENKCFDYNKNKSSVKIRTYDRSGQLFLISFLYPYYNILFKADNPLTTLIKGMKKSLQALCWFFNIHVDALANSEWLEIAMLEQ